LNTWSSYSDQELVQMLRDGSHPAFTELYDRYWEQMLAIAFAKLRSTTEAKEVVQTVFIQLWKRREQLHINYSFATYLSAAVRYQVINNLQAQYKSRHSDIEATDELLTDKDWLDNFEIREYLERSISQLPEKCQLVFRLSKQLGLSQKEVADQLNISEKTVEAHLSAARRSLRLSLRQFFSFLF
jgi:RNA polymerase sigma-70 factor (family 1)